MGEGAMTITALSTHVLIIHQSSAPASWQGWSGLSALTHSLSLSFSFLFLNRLRNTDLARIPGYGSHFCIWCSNCSIGGAPGLIRVAVRRRKCVEFRPGVAIRLAGRFREAHRWHLGIYHRSPDPGRGTPGLPRGWRFDLCERDDFLPKKPNQCTHLVKTAV